MKSFEQIARAMWDAYLQEHKRQGDHGAQHLSWQDLTEQGRACWIAAAQEAARQLVGVH